MKNRILIPVAIIAALLALAVPTLVMAHSLTFNPTTFYACEDTTTHALVTISQDDGLQCDLNTQTVVTWNAKGIQGDPGVQGTQGPQGDPGVQGTQGPAGPSGIPFTHTPCVEKLTGPAQQENLLFCVSGIEPDGGLVYKTAINAAAKLRIILGTPIAHTPSVDWSDRPIFYVEFTSEFHAEYHSPENIVRIYNASNQRVF